MMRLYTLFSFCIALFISNQIEAQNSGFIGKRTIVSMDVRAFVPSFYNIFNNRQTLEKKAVGGNFSDARNLLSYGANFSIGRTLSNQIAFHLQGSILNYKINLNSLYFGNGVLGIQEIQKATYFQNRAVGIMPIIEFTNYGGISPLGLSNQIGLGIYTHRPLEKDYLLLVGQNQDYSVINQENLFDYDKYRIRSYSIMYKIILRLAINRSLLFNLGFRYNLNITQSASSYSGTSDEFGFSERDFRNLVRKAQVFNVVSMETGLSFVF